jgi:hypothetical protein
MLALHSPFSSTSARPLLVLRQSDLSIHSMQPSFDFEKNAEVQKGMCLHRSIDRSLVSTLSLDLQFFFQLLVIRWNIVLLWPFLSHRLYYLIAQNNVPHHCPIILPALHGIFPPKRTLKVEVVLLSIRILNILLNIIGHSVAVLVFLSLFCHQLPHQPLQLLLLLLTVLSLFIVVTMTLVLILDLVCICFNCLVS